MNIGQLLRLFAVANPSAVQSLEITRNDLLYTSGERSEGVFLVEYGAVKTLCHSQVGKDCLLDIHASRDVLGESSLAGRTRAETAVAMMPSRLLYFSSDAFMQHLVETGRMNDWAHFLLSRLRERQDTITSLVTVDSERRLAVTLLRLAVRLGTNFEGMRRIDVRITHQELSEMVGTTRSRIGLFLKGFVSLGIVSMAKSGAMVVNEALLRRYVESGGPTRLMLAATGGVARFG